MNSFEIKNPFDNNIWPKNTNILCYHCCQKFKGKPLSMPIKYNERTNVFEVFGVFCSWECMKTYNTESNDSNRAYRNNLIFLLHGKVNNNFSTIKSAPPKFALKCFGGKLSIDEFRQSSKEISYSLLEHPLVPLNPFIDKNINFTWVSGDEATKNFDSYTPNVEENSLKIKRDKKKEIKSAQNTLEQSMGIFTSS